MKRNQKNIIPKWILNHLNRIEVTLAQISTAATRAWEWNNTKCSRKWFIFFFFAIYINFVFLSSCFTFISLCSIPLCSILFKWFELICFTQFRCLIFNSFKILLIFVFLHNICITSFSGSPIAALALKYMSWHIVRDDRTVPAMKFGRDVVFRSLASECDTIH